MARVRSKRTNDKPRAAPEAINYFRNKENQPSFDWRDVAPEEHAFVFTVAKATKIEVLNTIRAELDHAIANGETVESFRRRLAPKLIALGWWGKKRRRDPETGEMENVQLGSPRRLDTIYWANVRTANAAGAWERAQRTKATMPYFIYNLGPSEVHRPYHVVLEGTILPIDHAFWKQHYPPNGWGCKCWTSQLSAEEAKTLGYDPKAPAPDLGMTTYYNRRTGETRAIPVGVDPGWDTNPGMLRQRNLERHLQGQLDQAPEELLRVATKDVISSEMFQRIARGDAVGVAPVAVLPRATQAALGVSTRTVLFSDYTAAKGRKKHQESAADQYVKVQELIDSGERVSSKHNHMTLQKEIDGLWWTATIKATGDGREVYLQTFHGSHARQAESRRKAKARPEGRK